MLRVQAGGARAHEAALHCGRCEPKKLIGSCKSKRQSKQASDSPRRCQFYIKTKQSQQLTSNLQEAAGFKQDGLISQNRVFGLRDAGADQKDPGLGFPQVQDCKGFRKLNTAGECRLLRFEGLGVWVGVSQVSAFLLCCSWSMRIQISSTS